AYSNKCSAERGRLRSLLDSALADETGDIDAKMQWTVLTFCLKVFLKYGLKLIGWPAAIPFQNLSDGPVSMADIRELIGLCERDPERPAEPPQLRFVQATPEELREARMDASLACPGPLFPAPAPKYGYSNIGRRHPCPRYDEGGQLTQPRYERNGPKSAKIVPDEEDSEPSNANQEGLPRMYTRWGVQLIWHKGVWRELCDGELSDDPISDCE
ncbi:hypothetical protein OH76DRAFT_1490280, partial [Lentinus brumalis]